LATGYPYWKISWFFSAHPTKSQNDYSYLEKTLSSRLYVPSIYRATGPGIGDLFYITHSAIKIETLAQWTRSFNLASAQG
jgi:hypothetical protein